MSPYHVFLLALILPTTVYGNPLSHKCRGPNKTPPFSTNLATLMNKFKTTFPNALYYSDQISNAHALAQCRGDSTIPNCKACVANAVTDLFKLCPNNVEAMIWYDYCFLRFSDRPFSGQVSNADDSYIRNPTDITDDPYGVLNEDEFNGKVKELLTKLTAAAAWSTSLYAQKAMPYVGTSVTIYGMVQCNKDLNGAKCYQCLSAQLGHLKQCCDSSIGGHYLGSSCSFRYEVYPFVN